MKGVGTPVWDDIARPEDLAALDPGVPELPRTPDVLVIGGGQIGLATAVACRHAGLGSLLVIDRDRLARGPSGRNAGFLIPAGHEEWDQDWRHLATRSLALHRGQDLAWGCGLRNLDMLVMPDLLVRDQAHVDPLRVASVRARRAGVVATGVDALSLERSGDRVVKVKTSHGDVSPGLVVFATGSAPPESGDVRQDQVKGHMMTTHPAPFTLDKILIVDELGIVQLADNRLLIGGTKDFGDGSQEIAESSVDRLRKALHDAEPRSRDLETSHTWTCFRPHTPDEMPVVDKLPGTTNAWVVANMYHTGLLMAPVFGELLASWMADGSMPSELSVFSGSRAAVA